MRTFSGCLIFLLSILIFQWAGAQNIDPNKLKGPLGNKEFRIPERTRVPIPFHQFISNKSNIVDYRLSGEAEDTFHVNNEGWMYLNKSLDRETKTMYLMQIEAMDAENRAIDGPYTLSVTVIDVNDNPPVFEHSQYHGVVIENSRPGKPFMYVRATDQDDPETPNAQLSYSILNQIPDDDHLFFFQIDNATGAISVTPDGRNLLNPSNVKEYNLLVQVKDLKGISDKAFSANAKVIIAVKENLWKPPKPITVTENSTVPHPLKIAQVQWNEPGAVYELHQKERYPKFPFSIDKEGNIYVTEPLDREERDYYTLTVFVKDINGTELDTPLEIRVDVEDINDNPPVCADSFTAFQVQERASMGTHIGTIRAYDNDREKTENSILSYYLESQEPQVPSSSMFRVEELTGAIQLMDRRLDRRITSRYNVTVMVADSYNATGALKTHCFVQITVIDVNDNIPIFAQSHYNDSIPEDYLVGKAVLVIQATDADEPGTGSSAILYKIKEGDDDNHFEIETDPNTNEGHVKIIKPLDFENKSAFHLVVRAENPEPLHRVQYNESCTATINITVKNVNEPPVFSAVVYIANATEDVPKRTPLVGVKATDPEGDEVRYSLKGDSRRWLQIDSNNGEVVTADNMDFEMGMMYHVEVVATDQSDEHLSSSAHLQIWLSDVNDNAPRLTGNLEKVFCQPLQEKGKIQITATDDDTPSNGIPLTFTLGDAQTGNDWELSQLNGTHAMLSMKHTKFVENQYSIPIKIKDNGNFPREETYNIQVSVCKCSNKYSCDTDAKTNVGKPSVGMAVGILLGTLLVIGVLLAAIFCYLKKKKKPEQLSIKESEPLKSSDLP
ncbi:cadherin-17 [Protopterus annectens]|uniref:cadherin-17 n=1 Tax=Protopterus annectens TaxID=7888 RepID=UPI001CFC126A|nr:cadherin-17 [Protopterus annectens]